MLPLVWEFHSQAEQKQDSMNDSRQQLGFGAAGCLHRASGTRKSSRDKTSTLHSHTSPTTCLKEFTALSGQSKALSESSCALCPSPASSRSCSSLRTGFVLL